MMQYNNVSVLKKTDYTFEDNHQHKFYVTDTLLKLNRKETQRYEPWVVSMVLGIHSSYF